MSEPTIVHATPEENAKARDVLAINLAAAIEVTAEDTKDQPLSILVLAAKLLLEDMATLDAGATVKWLQAMQGELQARPDEDRIYFWTQQQAAFDAMARAAHRISQTIDPRMTT